MFNPRSSGPDLVRVTVRLPAGSDADGLRSGRRGRRAGAVRRRGAEGRRRGPTLTSRPEVPALGWRSWTSAGSAGRCRATRTVGLDLAADRRPRRRTHRRTSGYRVTARPGARRRTERASSTGAPAASCSGRRARQRMLRVTRSTRSTPSSARGPGTWCPTGPWSARRPRPPRPCGAEESPLGRAAGRHRALVGDIEYEQRVTLWDGAGPRGLPHPRPDDFTGADRLLRVRSRATCPGRVPVSEVADAVIGRGFALPDSDVARSAPVDAGQPGEHLLRARQHRDCRSLRDPCRRRARPGRASRSPRSWPTTGSAR